MVKTPYFQCKGYGFNPWSSWEEPGDTGGERRWFQAGWAWIPGLCALELAGEPEKLPEWGKGRMTARLGGEGRTEWQQVT